MPRSIAIRIIAILFFPHLGVWAAAPSQQSFSPKELAQGFRERTILAKPREDKAGAIAAAESREGLRVREKLSRLGDLRIIELVGAETPDAAIARLRATGRYQFVERDTIRHLDATPNDPSFADQWALANIGQAGGVPGVDIKAAKAWDILHDAPGVIVAIIDSGINRNHGDLTANIWTNPAPTSGINDLNGANFVGGAGLLVDGNISDSNGHGTHVAGIVGAVGNNTLGIAGVAWKVQLMAVKVFGTSGTGAASEIVAGINYAISHGAKIINASYGESAAAAFSQSELTAITAARNAGVVFVAAAGNDAASMDTTPHYPGSYAVDNIVTVGSSSRTETLSTFSNYGAVVDLLAPGEAILSLDYANNTGTTTRSGTSMAAPFVSGSLALLKVNFPSDNYRQLINRLLRGTETIAGYAGKSQTAGRLNLFGALTTTSNRPFNDDFATRARLSGDNCLVRSNNDGATSETGEPAHAGFAATATLWWEWTPTSTKAFRVTTAGSAYDSTLAVYTGTSVGSLTPVAANDNDVSSVTSRVDFTAQAGVAYKIAIGGKGGATGLTLLNIAPATTNDAFASPTPIIGVGVATTATNANASREAGEPNILGFGGGASLWYSWTSPRSGRIQVAAVSNDFDPLLAVYTGTALNALTLIGASDNTGTGGSQSASLCSFTATAGTTYLISVDTKTVAATGQFTLSVNDSLWQAITGSGSVPGSALTGTPAVAPDGTVYIGSTDRNLYAFASDGSLRWSFATGGAIDSCSPAIADDGTIYVGSVDGRFYAINPNGTSKWTRSLNVGLTNVAVSSSPTVATDGTIYVKASDGYLYALNPADGTTRWRDNLNAANSAASPSVAPDGTIYLGADDGKFYAVAPDGTVKWSFAADSGIYAACALDGTGGIYFSTIGSGKLYALSSAGTLRWTYSGATAASDTAPALSGDGATIYFGTYDQIVHAVNAATGGARWTLSLAGAIHASSPAVDSDGTVYIGCDDARLYAITSNGALKRAWSAGDMIRSSPAIFGGALYVGSNDHKLYALDLGGAVAGVGPWPQFHHNARRIGRADPRIATEPVAQTVNLGAPIRLSVVASASGNPTYQWRKNGVNIAGATNATLTINASSENDAGEYSCLVTNEVGAVASTIALVTVVSPSSSPIITVQPQSQTATEGQSVTLSVVASSSPTPSYQWLRNGTPLTGATGANYTIAVVKVVDAGNYTVVVANASGNSVSNAATLSVVPGAYLTNLSVRTSLVNSQQLEVGFVIRGGSKPVLVRAAGPGLAQFGVPGTMLDPRLQLFVFQGPDKIKIAENDDWTPNLAPISANVGAFPLQFGSKDAALSQLVTLDTVTRGVTAIASGTGPGVVLVEVYDASTPRDSSARFIDISARNRVGIGADILIAGFSLSGSGIHRFMVRGAGPSLTQFGIGNVLPDPLIVLRDANGVELSRNSGWNSDPALTAVFDSAGAFRFLQGSKDTALIYELVGGQSYTVSVSGASGDTGESLVEVYELP